MSFSTPSVQGTHSKNEEAAICSKSPLIGRIRSIAAPKPLPHPPRPGRQLRPRRLAVPLLALDEIGDFLVVDRSGPDNNCDEVSNEPPVSLSLD